MQITKVDMHAVGFQAGTASRSPPEQSKRAAKEAPGGSPREVPAAPAEPEVVDAAVDAVNQLLSLEQRAVRVVSREDAKGPVIEVIDRETEQVIRQIPSDKVLKLAAWFEENGVLSSNSPEGLSFDQTA